MADSVTAIELPDGVTETALIDHMRERYGVLISGGDSALMTLPADGMPVIVATQMPDSLITAHADARGGLGR